jgi:hypothetical protein
MGAESKDPEDFYRTKVASGSSTNTLSGKTMPWVPHRFALFAKEWVRFYSRYEAHIYVR